MKRIIGFLFYLYWYGVYNIVTYGSALIVMILSLPFPARDGSFLRYLVSLWSKTGVLLSFSKVEVRGRENLVEDAGVLLCNHQSTMDILVCAAYFPQDFLFFAKKEVYHLPLVGQLMRKMNYISVDRKNPKRAARSIMQAIEKIKNNNRVLIFPEGSRNTNPKELLPFKPGSMLIARQGKVPILPMVLYGTREVLPHDKMYVMPGRIILQILEPIYADDKMHPSQAKNVKEEEVILENLRAKLSKTYGELAKEVEKK